MNLEVRMIGLIYNPQCLLYYSPGFKRKWSEQELCVDFLQTDTTVHEVMVDT